MMQYEEFKTQLKESIEQSVGYDEQTEEYNNVIKNLNNVASDFNADVLGIRDDVVVVAIKEDQLNDFIDVIDSMTHIFGYDADSDTSDESIANVGIYIDPEIVMYSDDSDDDDDVILPDVGGSYDAMTEAKLITKFNSKGLRKRRFLCQQGFKYNRASGACEKIKGIERSHRRIGTKHAIITKKRGGDALKKRTLIKTRRAKRYRASAGVKNNG